MGKTSESARISLTCDSVFYEDCGQPYKEKVRNMPLKSRFMLFSPGLTQGACWYKALGFCLPLGSGSQGADTLSATAVLPLSHHSWLPSQGLLWVQIRGQLQVSADEGQLKNLGFVSTRGSQVLLCALGNVGPHFGKPILSPA